VSEDHPEEGPAYREGVNSDPEGARIQADMGGTLYDDSMYAEAEAAYREAVRLDPGNAQYRDDLGHALLARGVYAEAEAAFREAVRLDPGNARYERNLSSHWRMKRLWPIREDWNRYLSVDAPELENPTLDFPELEPRRVPSMQSELGVLRLEISGSWSVDAFVQLLTQVEQAYFAAAALEALAEPRSIGVSSFAGPREQTAKDLLDAVVAFRLGGGLQVRSLHYSSPGVSIRKSCGRVAGAYYSSRRS
jgi:tetratricopeptide (TPR) repeat protein